MVPLKRSSEEVLRRRSGDHLAILDPTGYLDIWADLDGVTQGDAAAFDSGISLTTLGLVSPTGPGCLVGFILGRHTTLGSFLHTYIVLGSRGGYRRCSRFQLAFKCDVRHEMVVPLFDECRVEVA